METRTVHDLYRDDLVVPIPRLGPVGPEMALCSAWYGTVPGFEPRMSASVHMPSEDCTEDEIAAQLEALSYDLKRNETQLQDALRQHSRCNSRASGSSAKTSRAPSRHRRSCMRSPSPKQSVYEPNAAKVPAVWPFPEPIPHEPPTANTSWQPTASTMASTGLAESSWAFESSQLRFPEHPYEPTTARKVGASFKKANVERANKWISEFKPKVWLLACEKAVWLQHKLEHEEQRKKRNKMLKNTMKTRIPFSSWVLEGNSDLFRRRHGLREQPESPMTALWADGVSDDFGDEDREFAEHGGHHQKRKKRQSKSNAYAPSRAGSPP